jgi:hypothetical protein
MIRYRFIIALAAALTALTYLGAWHAADRAPGVTNAGAGLAVPLDDVAIYFQYAKQALAGEWLRYSPGAALSTGVTSYTYGALLTGLMGLGLGGPWAAWLLGALSLLAAVVAMEALGRRLFPALPPWWAPVLLLCHGAWAGWAFNGMETGLLLALILCSALAALGESFGLLLALMLALAFTRPEGQVMALLLGAAFAWRTRRPAALIGAGFAAALPSALLIALSGGLVPDSLRAKSVALSTGQDAWGMLGQGSEHAVALLKGLWMGFWSGQDKVGIAGDASALNPASPLYPPLLLLAALFGFVTPKPREQRAFWLALAVSLSVLAALLAWQLPVGWHSHRYQAGAAPLLWLGALAALQALRAQGGLARSAAAALFLLWTAFGLASWPWHLQHCYQSALNYARVNRNAALALRNAPPGGIAVVDAGLLAYYSGRPTVDLLGITDHGLSLAQAQGKGALLEALLARPEPPVWAALHEARADVDLEAFKRLGILQSTPRVPLAEGLRLWHWAWHDAALQRQPAHLAEGERVAWELNTADLAQEAAAGFAADGDAARRSRAINQRLWEGGPQVPEGGRELSLEGFKRGPGTLVLRALFDEPGRLRVLDRDGRNLLVTAVDASPACCYSELRLPLPADAPQDVLIVFDGVSGRPAAWVSCHHWSVTTGR